MEEVKPKLDGYIYHIVEPAYFKSFDGKAEYFPARFEEEGFIHNCFEDQFEYVFTTHFNHVKEVLILKIDPIKIHARIIVEGDQHPKGFPHIYGPINVDAIVKIETRQLL